MTYRPDRTGVGVSAAFPWLSLLDSADSLVGVVPN